MPLCVDRESCELRSLDLSCLHSCCSHLFRGISSVSYTFSRSDAVCAVRVGKSSGSRSISEASPMWDLLNSEVDLKGDRHLAHATSTKHAHLNEMPG